MKKIVFFGAGNIAQSIILGLISAGHNKENILFIDRNRKFFLKNPRLSMMVRIFDKMKDERKKMILSEADKFIKKNTI